MRGEYFWESLCIILQYIFFNKHCLLFLQTSVLHMCSLFHAFIFAQLWTVYCEQTAVAPTVQNQNEFSFTAILTALEFWSRVTPSILQLMAHNKVVSQMLRMDLYRLYLDGAWLWNTSVSE